jgi:hypothetical protein
MGEFDEAARWARAFWQVHPIEPAYTSYVVSLVELGAWDDASALLNAMPVEAVNAPSEDLARVRPFLGAYLAAAQGDIDAAEQWAKTFSQTYLEPLPGWPDLSGAPGQWTRMLDVQALADIQRGEPQLALERYGIALAEPGDWYYQNFAAGLLPTPALVAVLHRLTGDAGTCDRILRDFLVRVAAEPIIGNEGIGFLRFTLHAFLGETDAAIAALEDAIKAGWLAGWWGLKAGAFDPKYAAVIADPRFVKLYAEIENRVRQMREDFLAHPDLPEGMGVR